MVATVEAVGTDVAATVVVAVDPWFVIHAEVKTKKVVDGVDLVLAVSACNLDTSVEAAALWCFG